ncbi:cytoskeleton-associated protein [Ophiostoma piceae UAMH 11346]|uniref:Cytoskeleton-associated protein n=1 Tax=Ophiostoma piceae (strain UAMH 11346) TaxID=1262450 RepID=S3CCK5_OPHP1|nr:cytoskeleton-associated protein [Ophiostoma piceae UAMH 11346]
MSWSWWRAFAPYERYIGIGLLTIAAGSLYIDFNFTIHDHFHTVFEEPATQPKTQYITQDTEDSLALDTLTSLLEHYNFSIRETAAKIVCDRAVNDDATLRRLLWGVARPDYAERMASLRALAMLTDQNTLARLHTREGVAAFVRSLQHCIDGSEDEERRLRDKGDDSEEARRAIRAAGDSMIADVTYDEYHMRDMAEKLCLMFVAQMAERFGVELLVRAGFVEKWLARQRWVEHPIPALPAAAAGQRIQNFAQYLKYRDNRIAYLCQKVMELPAGWAALEKTGLVEPKRVRPPKGLKKKKLASQQAQAQAQSDQAQEYRENDFTPANPSPLRAELRVVNGNVVSDTGDGGAEGRAALREIEGDEATEPTQPLAQSQSQQAGRRPTSQNTREEQRIRRQHREAMVLNDGTRPLRRDDIIERESD